MTTANIPPGQDFAALYGRREAEFSAQADALRQSSARWMQARLATFLVGLLLGLAALFVDPPTRGFLLLAALVAFGVFACTVVRHLGVRRELTRRRRLADLNRHQGARVARRWSELPPVRLPPLRGDVATARDLDVVGHASLVQLLGTVHAPSSRALLAEWLLQPAALDEIARRQRAVAALSPELEWRQDLEVRSLPLAEHDPEQEPFVRWAEGPSWLAAQPWLLPTAWLISISLVVLFALWMTGALQAAWWILPALASVTLSFARCGAVHAVFAQVSQREGQIAHYAELFAWAVTVPGQGAEIDALRAALRSHGAAADEALHQLRRIMDLGELRLSPLVWLPLQAITLWDFHVLALVERWKRMHGAHVRGWFATLARLEVLAALAALRHDQPQWCLPEFDTSDPPWLAGRQLGHPLIADRKRVVNDVELGPPGCFLLVTGSNMSGKSTLLRSIGCNVVLAQCGGPVAAASLRLPPLDVMTSMRVQDSLEDGVSFFLAELKRLKEVVDRADAVGDKGRALLYLLDEILQGTNSAERQTAVREVTQHLLRCRCLGAITTHDLHLAEAEPLASASRPVHFREHVGPDAAGKAAMTFDYILRPGIATTTNALRLLELVGLRASTGRD